jgi:hypothetical protein
MQEPVLKIMPGLNDGLSLEKPDFLGNPTVILAGNDCIVLHEYDSPLDGQELFLALQWMLSVYDNVRMECGVSYDNVYCYLYGEPKEFG